ncbi:hypothetical protein BCR43DRAFT_460581 [Syncephalastrum racemosum]|uniref:Class E vacuolar protein-sorting machinery protein HSE1 n=1 Tax=Syncephalastrum racemosum TaxID=13706 RepID=A0A1X2H8C5_SYNRA|nr:hypothetical protein BCR43DRAFT_460581 [Syncephalastrum racemosum]
MFAKANPYDEIVTSATNENLTSENWELILSVCDRVSRSPPEGARDCMAAVAKRFTSRNANVQLYALALSEALVKNCDVTVHREISSRSFTAALSKLIHDKGVHESVRKRALELIQFCSFEFRADPSLGLMNEIYHSMRAEGIQFPNPQKPKKEYTQTELDKQKEEEELQLALALSLSESENRSTYRPSAAASSASSAPRTANATTTQQVNSTTASAQQNESAAPKVSRVRALYDFQPTEQGELGFQKGDIIRVIESVYRDWWKGELRGQMGIFPVNYVEKIVDPSPADLMKEAQMEAEVMNEIQNVDKLLDILARIDPQRDSFSENEELQGLYNSTLSIRPKLVRLIEKYSMKKDELVALNEKFLQARTMYDRMLGSSLAKYTAPGGHPAYTSQQPYSGGYYDQALPQQSQPQQPQQQPQQQQAPYPSYGSPGPEPYPTYPQQPVQQQPPQQAYQQGYPPQPQSPAMPQQHEQPQQQGTPTQHHSPYGCPDPSRQSQQEQQQPAAQYPPASTASSYPITAPSYPPPSDQTSQYPPVQYNASPQQQHQQQQQQPLQQQQPQQPPVYGQPAYPPQPQQQPYAGAYAQNY